FVFRRDQPHVGWIVGYLLLLWFLFALMTQVRGAVEASGRRSGRLLVTAADYTIQSLCHGLLLFVLPAYWAATTFTSLNAPFIAPVPLFVTDATIGWIVGSVDSLEPALQAIPATELKERGLVAYTPIYAPAGLSQRVRHVWRQNGKVVEVVELSPVRVGRREGFRTYSRKTAFPADPAGRWTVDVSTSSGQ